ncbi:ribonuclease H-like domain-containing protein [Thiobacter aerophilum]|uniref:Ribonuclease H-like domain-containing protein n=1 Tax=Thiobacter aerophilum TaxID=3121275 RepID=A0ABV0EEI3_9BURK
MNLRDRLQKLTGQRGVEPYATVAPTQQSLAERLARLGRSPTRLSDEEVAAVLGGICLAEGLIVVERTVALSTLHGSRVLWEIMHAPLHRLDGGAVDPRELLFLDTETTGLAGGTGTLPFLLGLARIEKDSLRLRQFFLTGFKGEKALLNEALPWYREAAHLVSFNGKTFDLPLLVSRYRLARLPDPFASLGHLDLLYPTRTAFAHSWPDCRLQTAEQRLLDFHRRDDLPGHLVPQVWFDFVRAGHLTQVPAILEHNRLDLTSLVALAARLAKLFAQPEHPEADVLAIARAYRRRGEEDTAHAHLLGRHADLTIDGQLELARLFRRRGDWPAAVAIWQALAAQACPEAIECLAKHHEHMAKDPATALAYAHQLARLRPGPSTQKRIERLESRLARQSGPTRGNASLPLGSGKAHVKLP